MAAGHLEEHGLRAFARPQQRSAANLPIQGDQKTNRLLIGCQATFRQLVEERLQSGHLF